MEPAGVVICVIFGLMIVYLVVSRIVEAKNKKKGAAAPEANTEEIKEYGVKRNNRRGSVDPRRLLRFTQ